MGSSAVLAVLCGAVFAIGFLMGAVLGYSIFESEGKLNIRKLLQRKVPIRPFPKEADTRRERRAAVAFAPVKVVAPRLDPDGFVADETEEFFAELLDITSKGAGLCTRNFLKVGCTVRLLVDTREIKFDREAVVMNLSVTGRGLRAGVRFVEYGVTGR